MATKREDVCRVQLKKDLEHNESPAGRAEFLMSLRSANLPRPALAGVLMFFLMPQFTGGMREWTGRSNAQAVDRRSNISWCRTYGYGDGRICGCAHICGSTHWKRCSSSLYGFFKPTIPQRPTQSGPMHWSDRSVGVRGS